MFYKLYHISLQFVDVLFQLSIAQKGQQGTINSLADDHYLKWQFSGSLPTFQDIAIPDIDVIAGPGGRGCARQQSCATSWRPQDFSKVTQILMD